MDSGHGGVRITLPTQLYPHQDVPTMKDPTHIDRLPE